MSVTLTFEEAGRLPRLSWCARVERGGRAVVRHGADVETRAEGFVEGAWDGDFDAFDFDKAATLAGSGGRPRGDTIVFAAPFHPLEQLYLLREPERVFVSNSLVFLLAEAGDDFDIRHPNYFFDLLATVRAGMTAPAARLRTARGREAEVYPCCNLELDSELNVRRAAKLAGPPPATYADYFGLLASTTQAIARNATAPQRAAKYRLLTSCSSGYDSTAASAIASLAGCKEGVTYIHSTQVSANRIAGATVADGGDSGAASLRALGMSVTEYVRSDVMNIPGHPRAEFFISPIASTDACMRLMEEQLKGSLFVLGRTGERYWGLSKACGRINHREPENSHLSGHSLGEFRLRVGFLHLPIPLIGALHGPAIHRITRSAEMLPWTLGRGYDRPIARRIAEEAGVGRTLFGQTKRGGGLKTMSEESEEDFQRFLQSEVPEEIRRQLDSRSINERMPMHRRLRHLRTDYAHWPFAAAVFGLLGVDRMHALWNSTNLYRFHWGAAKVRERYIV